MTEKKAKEKPKPFKALRLDERDVFIALEVLEDESQLTPRHVDLRPHGGDCDRPPGEYRWNRERKCLEPLPRRQRSISGRPTMEQALAFDVLARWDRDPASVPEATLSWLDGLMCTADMAHFVKMDRAGRMHGHLLVAKYILARNLVQFVLSGGKEK